MSIWGKIIGIWNADGFDKAVGDEISPVPHEPPRYAIVDVEVGLKDRKIHDIGALRDDGAIFHKTSKKELSIIRCHSSNNSWRKVIADLRVFNLRKNHPVGLHSIHAPIPNAYQSRRRNHPAG